MGSRAYSPNELQRLAKLQAMLILDSPPEPQFDALVQVASLTCGTPISLLSLIDSDRQWFKANIGLPELCETARDRAFCAHAILDNALMEVPDALQDARFCQNALVTGSPHIRFYAGMPIQLADGSRVGTICVIDREPRRLNAVQRAILRNLAVIGAGLIEGRALASTPATVASQRRGRKLKLPRGSVQP